MKRPESFDEFLYAVNWCDKDELRELWDSMNAPQEFRPMKDAPRDGKQIILYVEAHAPLIGWWHNGQWVGSDWLGKSEHFIGWLPLPEAKAKEDGNGKK